MATEYMTAQCGESQTYPMGEKLICKHKQKQAHLKSLNSFLWHELLQTTVVHIRLAGTEKVYVRRRYSEGKRR